MKIRTVRALLEDLFIEIFCSLVSNITVESCELKTPNRENQRENRLSYDINKKL